MWCCCVILPGLIGGEPGIPEIVSASPILSMKPASHSSSYNRTADQCVDSSKRHTFGLIALKHTDHQQLAVASAHRSQRFPQYGYQAMSRSFQNVVFSLFLAGGSCSVVLWTTAQLELDHRIRNLNTQCVAVSRSKLETCSRNTDWATSLWINKEYPIRVTLRSRFSQSERRQRGKSVLWSVGRATG